MAKKNASQEVKSILSSRVTKAPASFVRPSAKPNRLVQAGRQFVNSVNAPFEALRRQSPQLVKAAGSGPLPQRIARGVRYAAPVVTRTMPGVNLVPKYGEGFAEASALNLVDIPMKKSTNKAQSGAYLAGAVTGYLNPFNPANKYGIYSGLDRLGAKAVSPIVNRVTNQAVKKVLPILAGETAQSAAYLTAQQMARKAGINQAPEIKLNNLSSMFSRDMAYGLFGRGAGRVLGNVLGRGVGEVQQPQRQLDKPIQVTPEIERALQDVRVLKLDELKFNRERLQEAYVDVLSGNRSKTDLPILLDLQGNIRDGYHRLAEAMQRGDKNIPTTMNKTIYNSLSMTYRPDLQYRDYDKGELEPIRGEGGLFQGSKKKLGFVSDADSTVDPLTQEARKYKSAEEFVKANTNAYHATTKDFTQFDVRKAVTDQGGAKAVFFSETSDGTKYYQRGNSKVMEASISPEAKVFDYRKNSDVIDKYVNQLSGYNQSQKESVTRLLNSGDWGKIESKDFQSFLKKNGFDGFRVKDMTGHEAIGITNTDLIKTKSQLTDIYNQATKQEAPKGPMMGFAAGFNPSAAKTNISTDQPLKGQDIPSGSIIQKRQLEIQGRLRQAQEDLELTSQTNQVANEAKEQFSGTQRKAISQIKRSMEAFERKGQDLTNVTNIPSYKKHVLGVMETLGTDSEDEALAFIKAFDTSTTGTKSQLMDIKTLEKDLEGLQQGVYRTPSGTVHYDPMGRATKLSQEKLADQDYREWAKNVYKDVAGQERNATRDAVDQITASIKTKTGTPLSKNVEQLKDISGFSGGFKDVYRNFKSVFGNRYGEVRRAILDPFDSAKKTMFEETDQKINGLKENVIDKYGFKPQTKESAAIQEFGEGTRDLDSLVKEFGQKKALQIQEADKWFRSEYDSLLEQVNEVRRRIYPNDPEKIIPRRNDYYRHFTEMSEGFQGLKNIFDTPANISSSLAGGSEFTRPKSKWLSFAQKRLGVKTDIDAVGGYLEYLKGAEYAKHIDPQIGKFRGLADDLAQQTLDGPNSGKLNNFIEFLQDYANDLSGKTNPSDRALQKYVPGGRKAFKALNWLNSRVKANVILGNLSSSVAQFFNIPQGIASAGPKHAITGIGETLAQVMRDDAPMKESGFLKERYFKSYDQFDTGMLDNVKKFAAWVTQIGDEVGTKYIWNMHYRKALEEGAINPVKYADEAARALVAGRGIGEVPLVQKSKVFQLIAPFQLEVANLWYVMKDFVDEKQFGKLATLFITGYLMNKGAEKIRGSDVTFDPIQATVDALQAYQEEEDKKVGLARAGGRIAGEVLSNVPMGQTVAAVYPEYGAKVGDTQLPTRKDLFGEGDPTRFGSGLLVAKAAQDPLYKILPPFGGAQIKKTIEGLSAVKRGYGESKSGKVQYPVAQTLRNTVQAGAFGKYAVPEAREYFKQERSVLGDNQTEEFKKSDDKGRFYDSLMKEREADKKYKEFKAIKDEAIQAYLNGDKETTKRLIQENGLQITNRDVETAKNAQKTKAIEAYINGDKATTKQLIEQYGLQIKNSDVQKKAKSQAISAYKKYLATKDDYYKQQAKQLIETYQLQITNREVQ